MPSKQNIEMPNDNTIDYILIGISVVVGLIIIAALIHYIVKKEPYCCDTSLESLLPPKLSVHFYHTEKIQLDIPKVLEMVNYIQMKLRNKVVFYDHTVQGDLSSINAAPYNALIRIVNLVNNNEVGIPLAKTPEFFTNDLQDNRVSDELDNFYKFKL
jgi:hypothetical protein